MRKLFRLIIEAVRGDEKEFTQGSIQRAIFLLSVPMVLEMVMESLFAIVDVFFVSRLGTDAVATVGLTESLLFIIYSLAIGLSMATTALVARRIGEKHPEAAAEVAVQASIIALFLSILIGLAGFLFSDKLLIMMGASPSVIASGLGYTQTMLIGNATVFFLFLLNAVFRGAGDAAIAMRSLWIANAINMVLDPCLIFGWGPFPEMGVAGAAVATNIGRSIGVLYQVFILFNGKSIIRPGAIRVKWDIITHILSISAGGVFQYLIGSASWIFMVRIISTFGSAAVAGYTIAIRIIIFTVLPSWGLANAAATLVGQNLGAQQPERAERSVWLAALYNMFFLAGVAVVFFIFADLFVSLFATDPEVIRLGALSLRIICGGYIFYAYGMVLTQAFNGAGDTLSPTLINILCQWIIQIPLAYFLALSLIKGPSGVIWAIAFSESILALVAIAVFRRGKWKSVKV